MLYQCQAPNTMLGPARKDLAFFRRKKGFRTAIGAPGIKTLLACAILISACIHVFVAPKENGILIYVPVHQASVKKLGDFATCMTQATPVLHDQRFRKRVDLLIMTNGDHELDESDADSVQSAMRSLSKWVPQISRVRLFLMLKFACGISLNRRLQTRTYTHHKKIKLRRFTRST